jgi:hypothetical protein
MKRILVIVLALVVVLGTALSMCSCSDVTSNDVSSESGEKMSFSEKENLKINERYKDCEVMHVSTTVGGRYANCYFLVVVKMTDGTVDLKQLFDNAVFLIDEGEPYIGGYGGGLIGLYITEADLLEYLN